MQSYGYFFYPPNIFAKKIDFSAKYTF